MQYVLAHMPDGSVITSKILNPIDVPDHFSWMKKEYPEAKLEVVEEPSKRHINN